MVRRLWVSAVAVTCVLVSACDAASGGGGNHDGLNLKTPPHASAVGAAEGLGGVTLGARDVDGWVVTSPADDAVTRQRNVKVADDVCDPVAYVLSATVVGKPSSRVVREAMGEKAAVTVVLAEYAGEQAQGALDDLSTAVAECADGFAVTVNGEERKVGKVAPEIAPDGADQAMGLGAVVELGGVKTPVKVVVLRKGATVGYISAVPTDKGDRDFAVPAAVIDAQLVKLG